MKAGKVGDEIVMSGQLSNGRVPIPSRSLPRVGNFSDLPFQIVNCKSEIQQAGLALSLAGGQEKQIPGF